MRLRPILTVIGLVVASLGSATTAADADIVRTRTLPSPLEAVTASCPGGSPDGSVAVVPSPPGIPYGWGTGSLLVRQGDADDVVGFSRAVDTLSSLSKVSVSVYDPDEYGTAWSDASTWIEVRATNGAGTFHLLWPLDLRGHATSWGSNWVYATTEGHQFREDDGGWVPVGDGTASLQEFVAQYGDGAGVVQVVRAPCYAGLTTGNPGWTPPSGLGTDTYLDAVTITLGDQNPPTYDFEDHVIGLSMTVGQTLITAGDKVRISGGVTRDGAAFSGLTVELRARPWDAAGWTKVGSAVSNSRGRVGLDVRPEQNTAYKWSYPTTRQTSPSLQIGVRPRLTLSIDDSTLHRGDTLHVRGTVRPPDRHYTAITLMRRTASGAVSLGRGYDTGNGHYRIDVVLKDRGTYKVFVTIAATKGNELGRTVTKKVTVS
jgi:hypothetical protein